MPDAPCTGFRHGAEAGHAPCTGSRDGAEADALTLIIGGDPGVFENGKPYFECVGKQFCRRGGPGPELHARLTNNMIIFNIMQ